MKRVYTQPEAELIVLDVNDVQMATLSLSEEQRGLTHDGFNGMFGWDKENGTSASSFTVNSLK